MRIRDSPFFSGLEGKLDEAGAELRELYAGVAGGVGQEAACGHAGMVLVSRMTGSPAAVTMKSLREQPRQPRAL